jgi:hypothetical protein
VTSPTYTFTTPLWETESMGAWKFVSLPAAASAAIRAVPRPPKPGFGSIRVAVTIGTSTWRTSIFPDSKEGVYVLPVKKAARFAERIEVGDRVEVTVDILE